MSNRHCIEKILEKQGSPSPKSITSSDHTEITCADKIKSEERFSASKELPKSFTKEPYSSFTPVRYSRMKRCYCPDCLQPPETVPPSWLRRSPPPMFLEAEKHPRSPCFVNYPYGLAYDRRPLGSSPLSARPRHYGPGVTMGAPKRKKRHRTAFTPTQLLGLENSFEQNQYSVGEERKQLAEFLGLSETQIKVWYQNRRTKYKRIRKEAEEDAREADVSHGGYMKYEDAEREVDRNHEGYAKYDDAKREVGRNHGHYSNYESCYPYCPDERSEEHAHAYRYERRWAYHSPYIGRERARDHSDTELRIVL